MRCWKTVGSGTSLDIPGKLSSLAYGTTSERFWITSVGGMASDMSQTVRCSSPGQLLHLQAIAGKVFVREAAAEVNRIAIFDEERWTDPLKNCERRQPAARKPKSSQSIALSITTPCLVQASSYEEIDKRQVTVPYRLAKRLGHRVSNSRGRTRTTMES